MKTKLIKRFEKLKRKVKKVMKGCGDECEKGGTCWHLSKNKQLFFNKDFTDSKLEKVRVYCDDCRIQIFEIEAQLRLLKEVLGEINKNGKRI